jgi:phage terminase small subunit
MFEMNEEQEALFDKLTKLQRAMALNDIAGMKPAENHKEAGGTCKNESDRRKLASEILTNHDVVAFLDSIKGIAVNDAVMSRDEALKILSNNARVKVSDIATFSYVCLGEDEEGQDIMGTVWKMKDSDEIDPNVMSCIKSVTMTKQGPKIELHDQQGAIKQLSTMQGWESAQKIEHDVNSVIRNIDITASPEEAARAYTEMMEGK